MHIGDGSWWDDDETAALAEFGAALRAARRARGTTQVELAGEFGVDQATVSRIEKNAGANRRSDALLRLLDRIAEVFPSAQYPRLAAAARRVQVIHAARDLDRLGQMPDGVSLDDAINGGGIDDLRQQCGDALKFGRILSARSQSAAAAAYNERWTKQDWSRWEHGETPWADALRRLVEPPVSLDPAVAVVWARLRPRDYQQPVGSWLTDDFTRSDEEKALLRGLASDDVAREADAQTKFEELLAERSERRLNRLANVLLDDVDHGNVQNLIHAITSELDRRGRVPPEEPSPVPVPATLGDVLDGATSTELRGLLDRLRDWRRDVGGVNADEVAREILASLPDRPDKVQDLLDAALLALAVRAAHRDPSLWQPPRQKESEVMLDVAGRAPADDQPNLLAAGLTMHDQLAHSFGAQQATAILGALVHRDAQHRRLVPLLRTYRIPVQETLTAERVRKMIRRPAEATPTSKRRIEGSLRPARPE